MSVRPSAPPTSNRLDRVLAVGFQTAAPALSNDDFESLRTIITFTDSDGSNIEFYLKRGAWVKYIVNGTLRMDSDFQFDLVDRYKLRVKGKLDGKMVNASVIAPMSPETWKVVSKSIPKESIPRPDTVIDEQTIQRMYKLWTKQPRASEEVLQEKYKKDDATRIKTLTAILSSPDQLAGSAGGQWPPSKTRLQGYLAHYADYANQNAKERWNGGYPEVAKPDLLAEYIDKALKVDMRDRSSYADTILQYLCDGEANISKYDKDKLAKVKTHLNKYLKGV